MKFLRKIRSRRGMTLVELLIVVAIIAVLVCIGVVMINPQDLSYVEYNRCAESIATAVQNRLTALRNAGQLADLRTLGIVDDPAEENTAVKTGASDEYRYIFNFEEGSTPNSNSSIRYFVPFGSIELQLEQGYFAIGFQAQSGMVGEVFYSEDPFDHSVAFLQSLSDVTTEEGKTDIVKGKNSGARKKAGIGYYVGEVDVREVAPAQLPTPQLTISNSEELTLSIYLPQVSQLVTYGKKLAVRVCLADAEGKAYSENKLTYEDTTIYSSYENIASYSAENDGLEMGKTYKIVLDTPDPAYQCDIQTGEVGNKSDISNPLSQTPKACFETWANETKAYRASLEGKDYFRLGDNVQITVFVYCLDDSGKVDNTYMERSASVVFNGWFDTFDGKHTVTIASGRHLQNLGNMTKMNDKMKSYLPDYAKSGTTYTYSNYSRGNAYQFTDEDSHVNKKWDYRPKGSSSDDCIVQNEITTAKQVKSIDFNNSVWKKGNDYIPFTPVNLPSGFTYYGNYQTIRHLWVDAPFYAGLFGYVYYVNLYDIMLVNPHVESHMPAYVAEIYEMGVGALIGTSRNSQNIYNCQAFMEAEGGTVKPDKTIEGGEYKSDVYRILGNGYVGGLIGFCEDENIRQNSASVYTGNSDGTSLYVGGLIGAITGDCNVKRCYGAGNLTGQYVGGLIGVVMEDSDSSGDNYYIEACYTAGHIEAATKSAAGLIGRVWEQGGYYKSALGANSNYCVVIYGKGSSGSYSWDSYVCDYKVTDAGTFEVLAEHKDTTTPIYGTFEGDGFEWLYSSEVGYFTGGVNGENMFLGADFHSDNQNYFIPQRDITYSDSPYFEIVKEAVDGTDGLVQKLKDAKFDKKTLQDVVNTYRNRLRYGKLIDALDGVKEEFENLLYELKGEEAGNADFERNSVFSQVQALYDDTFTETYNELKPALERLRDGDTSQKTTDEDKTTVAKFLTTDDDSEGLYNTVFRELRDRIFTAKDDTTKWFLEARVKDRIRYYLHTMDNAPESATLDNKLKCELQRQKLLGLQSALDAATAINTLAKDENKWKEADKMGPYKDFIKQLSQKAKEKLESLISLVEGESYKAYTQAEKAKYNEEGITLEYDDYSTTTPEELQALINEAYGYYNDLYRLFDAKETESVTFSKYTIALLLGINDPETIKEGKDYDTQLESHKINGQTIKWSDSSWAWKMTGGVKNIVDVGADGEIHTDDDSDDYGMRTFRDALSAKDARGSILKAGVELNSGIEGELDRIEYMCKLAEYYEVEKAYYDKLKAQGKEVEEKTLYDKFEDQILDCISDIETMLGVGWEGHDSGHRIYSAYELRQIRNSDAYDAINHDFVYKYQSLDDYNEANYSGYVDEDNEIYNNVFPYNENQYTHYYPFLFVKGMVVQDVGTASTDVLFHYGDWLTNDLWAPDPQTTGSGAHNYHSGNSAMDKLADMNSLLKLLADISEDGSTYWTDDAMKNYKSPISGLVVQAQNDMKELETAITTYEGKGEITEQDKKTLTDALKKAWNSYNDLWLYFSNKDYMKYSEGKKVKDATAATVVKQNGAFTIVESGSIGDLIKLIGEYTSFYNSVATAYELPTVSEDMQELWRLDLRLIEVQKTVEFWKDDKYYADAKELVDAARTALGEFITVAGKSKDDAEYKEKFKTARMTYWYAYSFFDQSAVKGADVAADHSGKPYTKELVGSGYEGTRRLRAVFGFDDKKDDGSKYYESPLDSLFKPGSDLPTWDELNQLGDLKEISRQIADLIKVTDEKSKFWNDEDGMKSFKEEVNAVLEKLQGEISAIFAGYDSNSDEMQKALIEAYKDCDYLYWYFDEDSHLNLTGVRITNVEDALDSQGTTEKCDGKSGGMRSLRSRFDDWREFLQSLAEVKKVTLPNSDLLRLEYALERLKDVKELSSSTKYWTETGIANQKTTIDGKLDTAINKIQSLLEMYDEYKANTAEKEADFKNALQEAWDACDKLYDTFKSGTLAEVEAELYLYTYKGVQYACVGKLNSLATLFRSYCRGVIATFAENEGITLIIN